MYRITSAFYFSSLAFCLLAQDAAPDRVTVPFSDAARPKFLRASLLNGSLTVKGYEGKDVIVESRPRGERRPPRTQRGAEGLRRIDMLAGGVDIEEENNVVKISGGHNRSADLLIQVPSNISLNLRCTNDGNLVVENVVGEIDVNNLNGDVTVTGVSGSVLANSLNGKVVVTMDKVTPDKPMAFSTLNGNIDVTLPGDTKGRLRLKSDNGDVWTDFDFKAEATRQPVVEDARTKGGKYRVRMDKHMYGTINGGGPEMRFETQNGNVYIRKKK